MSEQESTEVSGGRMDEWTDALVCLLLSHLPLKRRQIWQDRAKMTFSALELFESRARIAFHAGIHEGGLFEKKAELKNAVDEVGEQGQGSRQWWSRSPGWKGWYFVVRLTGNFKAEL